MHGRNLPTPKRIRSWCSYGSWRVHWVQRKSIHILDDNDDSHSSDSLFHSHFYRVQAPQHYPSSVHHVPNGFDFWLPQHVRLCCRLSTFGVHIDMEYSFLRFPDSNCVHRLVLDKSSFANIPTHDSHNSVFYK